MTISIRPAVASEAKPLIGLYAESGKGKTKSALLLAKGFAGDMARVVMIETESGRGEAYADDPLVGGFQVISLRGDFSPSTYGAAIAEAERSLAKVLIVDSASHEWEGVGGVLAMAAANQAANKKGPIVWQQPKIQHQREFMGRLLQTPIPLVIVCMRAKYPMYEVKARHVEQWEAAGSPGNRPKIGEWARHWALEPKQADDILYEMFVHGWIDDEHRFRGTKYTLEVLRQVLVDGEPISAATGERLGAWSQGRAPKSAPPPPLDEALLLRAKEHADLGLDKYQEFWGSLTPGQRAAIGAQRHADFKAIASDHNATAGATTGQP